MVYKFAILAVLALSQCTEAGRSPCVCARSGRPVCGSDGNTYRSECALACHNSDTGSAVTVAAAGACSTCICTLDYRPLCGSDGKTYPNQCSFDCFKTDSLRVMYDGPCLQGQMLASEKQCTCTDDNRPVCANNGQTYPNWCTFQCEMAKDSTLRVLREGACTQQINPTSWRPQVNTAVPSYGPSTRSPYESNTQRVPSYGSNTNRTPYGSNTQRVPSYESYPQNMQYGSSTPRVPSYGSNTPTVPSLRSQGNNCVCPRVMKPVCGTDGQTYNNECLLDCNNVPLARLGRCDQW